MLSQVRVDNTAMSSMLQSHGLAVHARSGPDFEAGEVLGFVPSIAETWATDGD